MPIQFLLLCVLSHCSDHLAYGEQKGRPCHRAGASPDSCIDWGCEKLIPPNWHHAVPTAPVNFWLFIILVYIRCTKRQKSFCWIWTIAGDGAWILHMLLWLQGLHPWNCVMWTEVLNKIQKQDTCFYIKGKQQIQNWNLNSFLLLPLKGQLLSLQSINTFYFIFFNSKSLWCIDFSLFYVTRSRQPWHS